MHSFPYESSAFHRTHQTVVAFWKWYLTFPVSHVLLPFPSAILFLPSGELHLLQRCLPLGSLCGSVSRLWSVRHCVCFTRPRLSGRLWPHSFVNLPPVVPRFSSLLLGDLPFIFHLPFFGERLGLFRDHLFVSGPCGFPAVCLCAAFRLLSSWCLLWAPYVDSCHLLALKISQLLMSWIRFLPHSLCSFWVW